MPVAVRYKAAVLSYESSRTVVERIFQLDFAVDILSMPVLQTWIQYTSHPEPNFPPISQSLDLGAKHSQLTKSANASRQTPSHSHPRFNLRAFLTA